MLNLLNQAQPSSCRQTLIYNLSAYPRWGRVPGQTVPWWPNQTPRIPHLVGWQSVLERTRLMTSRTSAPHISRVDQRRHLNADPRPFTENLLQTLLCLQHSIRGLKFLSRRRLHHLHRLWPFKRPSISITVLRSIAFCKLEVLGLLPLSCSAGFVELVDSVDNLSGSCTIRFSAR